MEEVSDSDDANKSSDESEDVSEIDSDEDLRLTSTDEEKEKVKKDKRKPRDDPERVRARKQRELRREILRWVLFIKSNSQHIFPSELKELQQGRSLRLGEALQEKEKAEETDGIRIGRKHSC